MRLFGFHKRKCQTVSTAEARKIQDTHALPIEVRETGLKVVK